MKNPICISTGCLRKITDNRNEMIEMLKEFSPQGIELSFAYSHFLSDFSFTESNLDFLRGLKFNSIHAPWKDIVYDKGPHCRKVLAKIEDIYYQVKAKNVVVEPRQVVDYEIFNNQNFIVSTENSDWKKEPNTPEQIGQILNQYPFLRFAFDFAHALTMNFRDITGFIEKFSNSISEVHIAGLDREIKDHWFLHKYDSPKIRNFLKMIETIDASLVLECAANNPDEINLIKNEIKYIRSI